MDLIHSQCFDLFLCILLITPLFVISGASPDRPHQSVDPCSPNPCQNRALCVRHNDGYMCYCVPGFQGSHCQLEVNECISQPCMNGATCEDKVGRFSCLCSPGFTGVTCEVDIDECQSQPCLSGGSCHDYPGGFNCTCVSGFQGQRCEINIDECHEQPCQNGAECIDGVNEYSCDCSHTAFMGTHCEIPQPACHSEPCFNGAICTDDGGNYTCECWPGFEGLQCETDIDECSSSPCMNGGRCIQRSQRELYGTEPLLPERYDQQHAAGYICSCPLGTAGSLCQEVINQCDPSPCQNGGSCESHVGNYTCHCLQQNNQGDLYGGVNCDVRLTGCEGNKCGEHGSCSPFLVDDTHGFTCSCSAGYTVPLCQISTTLSFEQSGYLLFESLLEDTEVSSNITLSFKTILPRVLLFHRQFQDLLLVLELKEGHPYFTLKKQGTDGAEVLNQVLELPYNIADGQWHSVEAVLQNRVFSLRILDLDHNCRSLTCHMAVLVERTENVSGFFLEKIFFGGIPPNANMPRQQSHLPAFIGCMQDIIVDQQLIVPEDWLSNDAVNVTLGCSHRDHCLSSPCQNGGQCVNLWQSYQCHCQRPYKGQDCEEEHATARFGHEDSSSYAALTVSHDLGQNFSISFFLRTQHSGLLMVLANNSSQYLHMWLMQGRITLQVNTSKVLRAEKAINNGKVHFVSVEVMYDRMKLLIEAEDQGEVDIRPIYVHKGDKVYVGGLNETRTTAVLGGYFKGCIQDLRVNDVQLQFFGLDTTERSFTLDVMENINAGCPGDDVCGSNPCLNGGTCHSTWDAFSCVCPSSISGRHCEEVQWCELSPCPPPAVCYMLYKGYECYSNATFLNDSTVLTYRGNGGVSKGVNTIVLNLRTQKLNAAILRAEKDPAFIILSVQDGFFVMELKSPVSADTEETGEQPVSTVTLRSHKKVSDGEWHHIFIYMVAPWALTSQWTLVLDEEKSITSRVHGGNLDFLREGVDIFVGGLAPGWPFVGCLGTIELAGIALSYYSPAEMNLPRVQKEQFILTSRQPLRGCTGAHMCEPNPCMNGGECHDYFNAYNCSCAQGWAGRNCEAFIDSCESRPCIHGNCSADGPDYRCTCEPGYIGVDCEEKEDVCENHLCAHGATCLHGPDTYACLCPENYTGPLCNERTEEIPWYIVVRKVRPKLPVSVCGDEIRNYTCFNGGNCTERQLSCDCPPGFTGHRCEQEVDECKSNPCLNGGYCRNLINKFICVCEMSFAGEFCQTDVSDIYFYVALLLWQNLFQLLSYLILRLDDEPEVDWGGND